MNDERMEIEEDLTAEDSGTHVSELLSPIWSVIGFDRCFANGLSYDEALEEIKKRTKEKHTGLCIVTDDAAARMNRPPVL